MRKLPKPNECVLEVFSDCISNIRNVELKSRLEACKDEIINASTDFEKKVMNNQTHMIQSNTKVADLVTNDEMSKVYTDKMAKKVAPGRKYYDKLLASPKNGICPLCGQRTVSTLDHYLPKKKYSVLAVTPINLIPACKDCNKDKGEKEFKSAFEETIHPYFDDIENEQWLFANIVEDEEIAITFYVKQPSSWNETLFKRVKRHFDIFKLNALYSSHAAEEICNIRYSLLKVYRNSGSEELKSYIKEFWDSNEDSHLNSWRTAMYRALYENDWFYREWIEKQSEILINN